MSDYQKSMIDELGLKQNKTKLVSTLQDKKNYVVHSLHKSAVLSLTGDETQEGSQGAEVRPRVLDGTAYPNEHRIPKAKSKLEKNFYKLFVRENH